MAKPQSVRSPVEAARRYAQSLPEEVSCREEVGSGAFWKAVGAEFLATWLLTVVGCGSCLDWLLPPESAPEGWLDLKVGLAFGLSVATLVRCLGHVSGAHMNPAVSLAFLAVGHVTMVRAAAYVLAQCLGSAAGASVVYGLTPARRRAAAGLGATRPARELHVSQAFGMEFLATFLVVLSVLANVDPRRTDPGSAAASIGLSYLVGHLLAFRYTGASINPARSLGPALLTNCWTHHWVYWVGPVLGGVLAAITYDYTQDSSDRRPKRSFRKKATREVNREISDLSHQTEMTATSNDYRI